MAKNLPVQCGGSEPQVTEANSLLTDFNTHTEVFVISVYMWEEENENERKEISVSVYQQGVASQ